MAAPSQPTDDDTPLVAAVEGVQGITGRLLGWVVGGILGVVGAVTTIIDLLNHHHGIGPYLLAGGFLLLFLAALDMWRTERKKVRRLNGVVERSGREETRLREDAQHLAHERDEWQRMAFKQGPSDTSAPLAVTSVEPSSIVSSATKATGATADRQALLRKCLVDFQTRGEYILRLPNMVRVVEEAPKWQNEVYDFLDGVLVDPMQAQLFAQNSEPIPGRPLGVGLNQRIGSQVAFLRDMLQNRLAHLVIKDSWQP